MTKYDEMCEAANKARKDFLAYRERSWRYFFAIINSLQNHCGIPRDKITYLKWNKEHAEGRRWLPAEDGMAYVPQGAIEYDETDGFWNLGVIVTLTPNTHFPKQWATFVLFIKEQNQAPLVKIGLDSKTQIVRLDDVNATNQYCELLTEQIVKSFSSSSQPSKPRSRFGIVTVTNRDERNDAERNEPNLGEPRLI